MRCDVYRSFSRMGGSEFLGLVELADVVLDPFPVGGGRSSFEIFAVGTPVIMLYNRTSILQVGAHHDARQAVNDYPTGMCRAACMNSTARKANTEYVL